MFNSLTRYSNTLEYVHNSKAPAVVKAINEGVKATGLPMTVKATRTPQARGDLNYSRITIKGDAFNAAGWRAMQVIVARALAQ
jgi:hypothetical protein